MYRYYPFNDWVIDFGNLVSNEALLCEESRLRHGILARGLVKCQWCYASGSFSLIKLSNEGCMAGQSYFHRACYINHYMHDRPLMCAKMSAKDGNHNRPTAWQYNMKRDHRSHSRFCTKCIDMLVIFIVRDSFGKQGQGTLSHPSLRIIASRYPQKIALSSSENLRWSISSDFKLDFIKRLN